jgi:molybdate transport system substrate-binding protein
VVAATALVLLVSACGGGESRPRLIVSAASSLTEALTSCSRDFSDADVKLQFAGSDELATQIRRGVKPDVFASANTKLPDALRSEGLLEDTVVFATNELVLAVPADSKISSIDDLTRPDVKLAIGSASVPVGSYTREVLARLPAAERKQILARVRSEEPDVKGIVGKLSQKAVDAGFVYATDVAAAGGKLKAIDLPSKTQPTVQYGAGVVKGTERGEASREYVEELMSGPCADALERVGFGLAP